MSTGLIIDIVLLVIAAVTIIRYTFKGAVKAVFSFAKTFVALFLAYVLRKPAAMLINTLFMERSVTGWVYDSLYAASQGIKPDGVDLVKLYNDMPSFFTKILSGFGLDAEGIEAAFDSIPGATEAEIIAISENIGTSIATMLSTIIGFVAVFLLALLVLTIVVHILDKLTHLPIINFANKLLGAAIGVLISLLIIWIVSVIAGFLVNYIGPLVPTVFNEGLIEESFVLRTMKNAELIDTLSMYIH
ncbi:MAG: CvpA family protein [Clostridia bacterium]|nr:CvpA family protein [Clostridia bacterium]